MPKSSPAAPSPTAPAAGVATDAGDGPLFPLDVLRSRADWLARAAREACRQHRRCATLSEHPDVDPLELDGALDLAAVADRQLGEAAEAYAKSGARLCPDGDERGWWHHANALWLAAREHVRRHSLGDRLSKRVGVEPSPDRLTQLHVEYALEASAMLSLQQATDAYCKARPSVA
jgi:hypothetical protein